MDRGSTQELRRLCKNLFSLSMLIGLEPTGAAAVKFEETCPIDAVAPISIRLWMWIAIMTIGFIAVMVLGFYGWKILQKATQDLDSCWNQVADLDDFAGRIRQDHGTHTQLALQQWEDRGNELSMLTDYAEGLHFALVEQGGFVRRIMGLETEQRVEMNRIESANLISFNAMGSERYLRLVRQRAIVLAGDNTDDAQEEAAGIEEGEEPELLDELRVEMSNMLAREGWHHASVTQWLILHVLDAIRDGGTLEARLEIKAKCRATFTNLATLSLQRGSDASAAMYRAIADSFRNT